MLPSVNVVDTFAQGINIEKPLRHNAWFAVENLELNKDLLPVRIIDEWIDKVSRECRTTFDHELHSSNSFNFDQDVNAILLGKLCEAFSLEGELYHEARVVAGIERSFEKTLNRLW